MRIVAAQRQVCAWPVSRRNLFTVVSLQGRWASHPLSKSCTRAPLPSSDSNPAFAFFSCSVSPCSVLPSFPPCRRGFAPHHLPPCPVRLPARLLYALPVCGPASALRGFAFRCATNCGVARGPSQEHAERTCVFSMTRGTGSTTNLSVQEYSNHAKKTEIRTMQDSLAYK